MAAAFDLGKGKVLRIAVFVLAAVEFAAWLATVVWAARVRPGFDISGAHAILVFLVIPALLIGAWGRWLPFALTLLGVGAWMGLSVLIGSQISN